MIFNGKQLISKFHGHTSLLLLSVPRASMFVVFGFPSRNSKHQPYGWMMDADG